MARARVLFEKSGLTLADLGEKLGYPPDTAQQSAWQFIQKTDDPGLSMLERFPKATGISVKDLL